MAFPLVPPPANDFGALTFPRMLQRWLDVNRVTRLTRTNSFINLPAFSQDVTWKGYSEIVVAFNFEGPNNFSFTSLPLIANPNYVLCVMWIDSNRITHRYSFWRGAGEVFYFPAPLYNNQLIKKNFRFEVWSTPTSPASQSTALTFYTSVLGGLDYRWGGDFQLVNNNAPCTNFQDIGSNVPVPTQTGLLNFWESWNDLSWIGSTLPARITTWTDVNGGQVFNNQNNTGPQVQNIGLQGTLNVPIVRIGGGSGPDLGDALLATFNANVQSVYLVCKLNGYGGFNLVYASGNWLLQSTNTGLKAGTAQINVNNGNWYVIVIVNGGALFAYDLQTKALIASNAGAVTIGNITSIQLSDYPYDLTNLITYSTVPTLQQQQEVVNWLSNAFFPFNLLMNFPAGSTSTINT